MTAIEGLFVAALLVLFLYAVYRFVSELWNLRKIRLFTKASSRCTTPECIKQVAEDHEMMDLYLEIESRVNKRMVATQGTNDEDYAIINVVSPHNTSFRLVRVPKHYSLTLKYLNGKSYRVHPNRVVQSTGEIPQPIMQELVRRLSLDTRAPWGYGTDPSKVDYTVFIDTVAERFYTEAEKSILEETSQKIVKPDHSKEEEKSITPPPSSTLPSLPTPSDLSEAFI